MSSDRLELEKFFNVWFDVGRYVLHGQRDAVSTKNILEVIVNEPRREVEKLYLLNIVYGFFTNEERALCRKYMSDVIGCECNDLDGCRRTCDSAKLDMSLKNWDGVKLCNRFLQRAFRDVLRKNQIIQQLVLSHLL